MFLFGLPNLIVLLPVPGYVTRLVTRLRRTVELHPVILAG